MQGIERRSGATERIAISMGDIIRNNLNPDGIDRRGFLKCMAWAGTGTFCLMQGGVLKSYAFGHANHLDRAAMKSDFVFAQISDSHIGFDKAANPDVTATLQVAIAKLNALPGAPDFVLHTGDLTQLSEGLGIRHSGSGLEERAHGSDFLCSRRARRAQR